MELTVAQPCPTCGAEIVLREDERLLRCDYCDVNNYMVHSSLPRFLLPARLPTHIQQRDLFYLPYLRFKGVVYTYGGQKVRHSIIDTTRAGSGLEKIPLSLGLRPQVMNILPVTANTPGGFIKQSVAAKTVFKEAAKLTTVVSGSRKNKFIHMAFIGESLSRIYLPVYCHRGALYDGVTRRMLLEEVVSDNLEALSVAGRKEWEPKFISTLCPGCGDPMEAAGGSLVMICTNCDSGWLEQGGRFEAADGLTVKGSADCGYVPFWYLKTTTAGAELASFADFLELTNQPVMIRKSHREKQLAFMVPAFKANPRTYLQAARNFTLRQGLFPDGERTFKGHRYPVTMPSGEAAQSIKSVLAFCAVSHVKIRELIGRLSFTVAAPKLIYLPFRDAGHDVIQEQSGISISAAALKYGLKM
ncbi:Rcat domain-containing protein [Desulforhopalus singaporensis]|uniref:Uncharacterized protein n=1 Tax=Desulforhopalus singaporensis TaxID=91360 RepID=A0A1H0LKK4_9BACT|nr:zf-TFIIB domain-containing protein [Desulforhopalus singaporensis]SDO68521.1 hypothetical protein SAMN05660330_00831 [Desulforhopalus singaporensis]